MKLDHGLLREVLEVARSRSGLPDMIAPFGFEILGPATFAHTQIQRIYVYFPGNANRELSVLEHFMTVAEGIYPTLASNIRWGITSTDLLRTNDDANMNLYVFARDVETPVISAYSRHMVAAALRLANAALPELQQFSTTSSARRFVYQVGVVAQGLLQESSYLAGFDGVFSAIARVPNRDWATGQTVKSAPLLGETALLHGVISRSCSELADYLKGDDAIRIVDFNNGLIENLYANANRFALLTSRLDQAYRDFTREAQWS